MNGHFWPFQIYTSLFGKNCQKKFRTSIFGHSKFLQVFLYQKGLNKFRMHIFGQCGEIVRKNLEQLFLAIMNLYQSFWKNCQKKFEMAIFGHSEFIAVFLGKIVGKIMNGHFWPFQIYTSTFGKNCWKKFGMAIFGHSKFIPVFLRKIVRKNSEWPFLTILNLYQSFWEKLSEKNWNSHFWPFQIPNLHQSFWEKL